jgi:nicotinate-nucleotide pyrophosphorylase (carboxylating)
MSNYISLRRKQFSFDKFITSALREDLGEGDHTTLATISAAQRGTMQLLAKESGVIAGVEAAQLIFKKLDPRCRIKVLINDGAKVTPGSVVLNITGNTRKLLAAERTVLNVMQRMSGIATHTASLQALCEGTRARVIDTRKTTPGFRFFEKWAVVIGGGANHRFGLYDMVLIKDNHIDFAGGIAQAIDAARKYLKRKKKRIPVEIEARTVSEVRQILEHGGVNRIMLDNFDIPQTNEAVRMIAGKFEVESSGGINAQTIKAYAACGVDFISVGALTHQVSSLDLSLKAVK